VSRVRKRKTARDIAACFAQLRACYPIQLRIYLVLDNLSANRRAAADYCPGPNMEAVYLPTEASWLNAIEAAFTALHGATLKIPMTVTISRAGGASIVTCAGATGNIVRRMRILPDLCVRYLERHSYCLKAPVGLESTMR
jgi:hypothetical protein